MVWFGPCWSVFWVRALVLVCMGVALVEFQRWLHLQRETRRWELGWECAGERSPEK